jgi:hypothetical protein
MGIMPDKKIEQLQFCESHWPVWTANAAAIGVAPAAVLAFKNTTIAARTAYDAAQNARNAARAATTTQDGALGQMRTAAADIIRSIKAFAEQQANPDAVYGLAQIPPPALPTPAPAPGLPTEVAVSLESNGAVTLRWKAVNSAPNAGTFFSIRRKTAGQTGFILIGNTGGKVFTDETITQGTTAAWYIIQGHRGTEDGPATEQIGVQFGVGGGVNVTNAEFKIAA